MAEINLLQGSGYKHTDPNKFKLLNIIGVFLIILVILVYVLLWFLSGQAGKAIEQSNIEQTQIKTKIQEQSQYSKLVKSQSGLSNLKLLLNHHLAWSEVIPRFADATLKTASYSQFQANQGGSVLITGVVPDFQELDKLIKAYQLPDFPYIKDVKLMNIAVGSEDSNGITYTVKVTFNTDLLKLKLGQQ